MMRGLFLLAVVLLSGPAVADSVLPRLGPLPVLAEDGSVSGEANIPFGQRLTILSEDGAVLTVQDDTGQQLRVRATDVIAAPKAGLTLMPADQAAGSATDRPDLQLWDSAFQLRVFLDGAGSGKLVPSLIIPAGTDLAKTQLPVLSVDKAETSVGTPVTMVQALFPLMLKALDPVGQDQGHKVVLHVLVDGSDYARPFMLDKLRLLSRALAEQPTQLGEEVHFTRQVLFESGAMRDDGEVSASGLRSEWPAAPDDKKKAGLTAALSAALAGLADGIDPADPATHLVLILLGPGLSDDASALKSATAVGARLAARRADGAKIQGILLAQGTPEPNPANAVVLADVAGGAQTKLADFGADLLSDIAGLKTVKTQDTKASLVKSVCADAAAEGLPCLLPTGSTLPPETSTVLAAKGHTTWVALPLWLVSESAPLDLVPDGSVAADVHANQADIRACSAVGYVWDAAAKACGPAVEAQGADPSGELIAAQEEISTVAAERDAARDTLVQKQAEWQDQTSALNGQLSSAEKDRDAARASVAQLQVTVTSQTAALAESQTAAAAQADQLSQLAAEEQTVKSDLLAAQSRAAELSATLDQRNTELQAATAQIAKLGQEQGQINAALNAAQTQLATLQKTAATLTQSLDEARAAKADIEAKATQAEADLQDRLMASQSHSAELEKSAAALSQSLDDERAAKAKVEASAAQAQADLQDRLKASEASSAALQAQIVQAQATITTLTAAKDDVSARLAKAVAAQALAEQGLQDKDAKIAALGADIETLNGAAKDSAQQLADLGATLDNERQTSQTMQAKAAADIAQLNGEVADLTKTGDVNATLLAQSDDAKARLAALQTKNDALAKANADATSQLKDLSGAAGQTNAKLAQVSQDLATARQRLQAAQTQSAGQIAALQAQVKDLTKTGGDLSDQIAQLGAQKDKQLAALQSERDVLAKRVNDLEAQAKIAPPVADQPAMTSELSVAAEAPLFATDATQRPKSRPAGLLASATPAAPSAQAKAKGPALAVLTPSAKVTPDVVPRQVAPSLKTPALNGCQFEWTGQAGRLVCP